MFIYNLKLNTKVLYIVLVVFVAIFIIGLNFIELFEKNPNKIPKEKLDYIIDTENFAATVKAIHENIDENIGKTVYITGFVFKMPDFDKNYFLCGRNMIVDGTDKVAGILCQTDDAYKYIDGQWVTLKGTIIKGSYLNEMPVIKIKSIEKIDEYEDSYIEMNDKKSI